MPTDLCIIYGCFYTTAAVLISCYRDHVVCKVENIYSLGFDKKHFADTCLA